MPSLTIVTRLSLRAYYVNSLKAGKPIFLKFQSSHEKKWMLYTFPYFSLSEILSEFSDPVQATAQFPVAYISIGASPT